MKKYRVTEKHLFLKKCEIWIDDTDSVDILYKNEGYLNINIDLLNIDYWFEKGWIEEIEEKEFTKRDMIEFASYRIRTSLGNTTSYDEFFEQWLKQRNENI